MRLFFTQMHITKKIKKHIDTLPHTTYTIYMKQMYETLFKKHIDITWRDATTKQHFFMCFSKSGNLFFVNADTFEEFFDTDPDLQSYQLCITALDEISDCILGSASASLTYQPAEEVSLQKNHYQNIRIPQRELYLESISVEPQRNHKGYGQTILRILLYEGIELQADLIHGIFYPHQSLNPYAPDDQRYAKLFYKKQGIVVTALPYQHELTSNYLYGNLHNLEQERLQTDFKKHLVSSTNKQCYILDLFETSQLTKEEKQTILHNVEAWMRTQANKPHPSRLFRQIEYDREPTK